MRPSGYAIATLGLLVVGALVPQELGAQLWRDILVATANDVLATAGDDLSAQESADIVQEVCDVTEFLLGDESFWDAVVIAAAEDPEGAEAVVSDLNAFANTFLVAEATLLSGAGLSDEGVERVVNAASELQSVTLPLPPGHTVIFEIRQFNYAVCAAAERLVRIANDTERRAIRNGVIGGLLGLVVVGVDGAVAAGSLAVPVSWLGSAAVTTTSIATGGVMIARGIDALAR